MHASEEPAKGERDEARGWMKKEEEGDFLYTFGRRGKRRHKGGRKTEKGYCMAAAFAAAKAVGEEGGGGKSIQQRTVSREEDLHVPKAPQALEMRVRAPE